MLRHVTSLSVLVLVLSSCSPSSSAADEIAWGHEAAVYFDALAGAYTANDLYGVLDFYTPDAFIEKWRGDLRGGATVRDLMVWNAGDLGQRIQSLHIGSTGAIALTAWLATDDLSAVMSDVSGGWVSGETVFDLASSLDRSLRASPDVLERYEALYEAYAQAWTDGTMTEFTSLYAPEAHIVDPLRSIDVTGRDAIVAHHQAENRQVDMTELSRVGGDPSDDSAAIYLGPAEYGNDPGRAIGIFIMREEDGCDRQMAVLWRLEDGLITGESRHHEIESFAKCEQGTMPEGWWSDLSLPPPRDGVVTSVLRTPLGHEMKVHNGTPRLVDLVHAGLMRFGESGIGEPSFDSVTFEPSRKCTERSGRLIEKDGVRELFLCFYESDLCPGSEPCTEPSLSVRASVMHELAHAWMLDYLSPETRSRLLQFKGLDTWDDEEAAWPDRGVEYSAEVIAWGLLDDPAPMARIGRPPCEELMTSFVLLTDAEPLAPAADCEMG